MLTFVSMRVDERGGRLQWWIGAAAALVGAASWSQPDVAGSDLWWHLASGRAIWERGWVLSQDPFSYTFGGRLWMNHEWLWDVLYWGAWRLHPQAAAWLNLGILLTVFALAAWLGYRTSGSKLGAGAALWLVAATSHWFMDIRPHVTTLLLLAIFLVTRNIRWAPWLWPAMVVVWANAHAGFSFGIGAIGLFVLVKTIEKSLEEQRLVAPRPQWIGLALCLVAWVANPWGWRILEYPLEYLGSDTAFRGILEWQAPGFSYDLRSFAGRFTLLALVAGVGALFTWRRSRYLVALALVTFVMAWTSRRFIPLFALTALPLVACAIGRAAHAVRDAWPALRRPIVAIGVPVAALAVAIWLWTGTRFHPQLLERWTNRNDFPEAAVLYLQTIEAPPRVMNFYNWGGFLLLQAPGFQVFIDGRANTLYDEEIFNDYRAILGGAANFPDLVAKYPADVALFPSGSPPVGGLLSLGWREIYRDLLATALVPPDSPLLQRPLPSPTRVLAEHPQMRLALASHKGNTGDVDGAIRDLEAIVADEPLMLRAHGGLVLLHAERGDRDAVRAAVRRGVSVYPRRAARLRAFEADAWEQLDDLPMALRALRSSIRRGPFNDPESIERRIRELESRIESRSSGG